MDTDSIRKTAFLEYAPDLLALVGDAGARFESADLVELPGLVRRADCVLRLALGWRVGSMMWTPSSGWSGGRRPGLCRHRPARALDAARRARLLRRSRPRARPGALGTVQNLTSYLVWTRWC